MKVLSRLMLLAGYTKQQWSQLSQQERNDYLKKHPNSKYANQKLGEKRIRYQDLLKNAKDNVEYNKQLVQKYKQLLDRVNHDL